jgi:chromosomal replication initiation ATPase DnaA
MNFYIIPGLKNIDGRPAYLKSEATQLKYAREIIQLTADYFEIPLNKLFKKDRHRQYVQTCQIATWIIYQKMPNVPLIKVAELFGQRYEGKDGFDHSAIIYNRKVIQDRINVKDNLMDDVEALLKII